MKLKKWLVSTLAVAMTLATAFSLAGCKGNVIPEDPIDLPDDPAFTNAAVHDPSVFYDVSTSTYYSFGSHYAVASSKDLVNWEQRASDGQWAALYGNESVVIIGVTWPKAI